MHYGYIYEIRNDINGHTTYVGKHWYTNGCPEGFVSGRTLTRKA